MKSFLIIESTADASPLKFLTDLFLENREALLYEIDYIISSLSEYRTAIESDDAESLTKLLRDGRIAKEKIDG